MRTLWGWGKGVANAFVLTGSPGWLVIAQIKLSQDTKSDLETASLKKNKSGFSQLD